MVNPILIPIIIIIITIVIIKKVTSHPLKTVKNPPPSPPKLPILGNLHQFGSLVHRSLHGLSLLHGPVMLVQFGSRPVVIISSAAAAREVMRTQDTVFASRPNFEGSNADKLVYDSKGMSTSPYGEYWRQVRSICVLHLLCTKRVKSYRSIREEETTSLVKAITNLNHDGKVINMTEMFTTLTYNVGSRVVLGKKYGEESEKKRLKSLAVELVGFLGSYSIGEFIPSLTWVNRVNGLEGRVRRLAKEFDEFLEVIIEEHVNERLSKVKDEYEKDFVDVLLDFHEGSKKDGSFPLDRDSVKALIVDMFVGGTDSISSLLEWAISQLLRHPNILKKLQAEVDQAVAGNPSLSESDLDKMPYLKAVIKETLRLCPPSPLVVPRVAMQDCKVQGFDIAAGTWVIVSAWAVGRDANVWDNPEEFNPERFLSQSNNNNNNNNHNEIDSFGLIAFGAGRRSCPGSLFASNEVEFVLASVVHKFDLGLPEGNEVEDLDMNEVPGFTSHRKVPLYCIAKPRSIVT